MTIERNAISAQVACNRECICLAGSKKRFPDDFDRHPASPVVGPHPGAFSDAKAVIELRRPVLFQPIAPESDLRPGRSKRARGLVHRVACFDVEHERAAGFSPQGVVPRSAVDEDRAGPITLEGRCPRVGIVQSCDNDLRTALREQCCNPGDFHRQCVVKDVHCLDRALLKQCRGLTRLGISKRRPIAERPPVGDLQDREAQGWHGSRPWNKQCASGTGARSH